jgi:hypothetical protein
MKTKLLLFLCPLVFILLFLGIVLPPHEASAAPHAQFVTATPGPDGRILYTVVGGDTCLQVALLHGITETQLRQFNTRLDADCTLTVGQQLVVGLAAAAGPTAGPAPTLPPPTATTTPVSGTDGGLCFAVR